MTYRYSAPELLQLGRPPALARVTFDTLFADSKARLVAEFDLRGIAYDVTNLEANPGVFLTRTGVWRDTLRRQAIDDAIAQGYLGSATGAFLDRRAADYGVLRRSLPQGTTPPGRRPDAVPPAWVFDAVALVWREDDESLRMMARLAWEALSVAGPPGAYAFHARAAHPAVHMSGTAIYGPESGHVGPGEVLVVVQGVFGNGVPTVAVLDAVAERLDAYEVIDGFGASRFRTVRDDQSVRPLGARVTVRACLPLLYPVDAILYVGAGTDRTVIEAEARRRLTAYDARRRLVGRHATRSGILTALSLAGADGLPVVDDIDLAAPATDVEPSYLQLATLGETRVRVMVR